MSFFYFPNTRPTVPLRLGRFDDDLVKVVGEKVDEGHRFGHGAHGVARGRQQRDRLLAVRGVRGKFGVRGQAPNVDDDFVDARHCAYLGMSDSRRALHVKGEVHVFLIQALRAEPRAAAGIGAGDVDERHRGLPDRQRMDDFHRFRVDDVHRVGILQCDVNAGVVRTRPNAMRTPAGVVDARHERRRAAVWRTTVNERLVQVADRNVRIINAVNRDEVRMIGSRPRVHYGFDFERFGVYDRSRFAVDRHAEPNFLAVRGNGKIRGSAGVGRNRDVLNDPAFGHVDDVERVGVQVVDVG
jgi:hypothetical protein